MLIAILAVVLAGKGVGALQEAGMIPITLVPGGPRIPLLGISPTAEALGAQLVTLLIVIFGFRSSRRKSEAAASPELGRESDRERVVSTGRSRCSPYHKKKNKKK